MFSPKFRDFTWTDDQILLRHFSRWNNDPVTDKISGYTGELIYKDYGEHCFRFCFRIWKTQFPGTLKWLIVPILEEISHIFTSSIFHHGELLVCSSWSYHSRWGLGCAIRSSKPCCCCFQQAAIDHDQSDRNKWWLLLLFLDQRWRRSHIHERCRRRVQRLVDWLWRLHLRQGLESRQCSVSDQPPLPIAFHMIKPESPSQLYTTS